MTSDEKLILFIYQLTGKSINFNQTKKEMSKLKIQRDRKMVEESLTSEEYAELYSVNEEPIEFKFTKKVKGRKSNPPYNKIKKSVESLKLEFSRIKRLSLYEDLPVLKEKINSKIIESDQIGLEKESNDLTRLLTKISSYERRSSILIERA